MKTFFATQADDSIDHLLTGGAGPGSAPGGSAPSLSSGLEARSVWQGSEPFASLNLPQFGKVYADGARRAGRINAAHISPEEHNVLLRERQALLDKMLAGTMTKKESNKLAYIRWSLDRIEDAKYGETLDQLESVVSEYEQLLSAIHALGDKLSGELGKGRRK